MASGYQCSHRHQSFYELAVDHFATSNHKQKHSFEKGKVKFDKQILKQQIKNNAGNNEQWHSMKFKLEVCAKDYTNYYISYDKKLISC